MKLKYILTITIIFLFIFNIIPFSNVYANKKIIDSNKEDLSILDETSNYYDLIIITSEKFTSCLTPLKTHKDLYDIKTKYSYLSMEQQERTRLLLLSPETSPEKIKDAILLKIEKESNRKAFKEFMESDSKRCWLRSRVTAIKTAYIENVIIPEDLRNEIAERFFKRHSSLIPRHQRDISRLLSMIKAHALHMLGLHNLLPQP